MKKFSILIPITLLAMSVACSGNGNAPVQTDDSIPDNNVEEEIEVVEEKDEEGPILNIDFSEGKEKENAFLSPDVAKLVLIDGGITLGLEDDFTDRFSELGSPEIEEGQACMDEGYDTNYYYNGEDLIVYTYAKEGKQIINGLYASQKGIKTPDGIEISVTTKDDIFDKYGDANQTFGSTWTYLVGDGNTKLSFTFNKKDVLTGIDISVDSN